MREEPDAIRRRVMLAAPVEEAFRAFAERLGAWWPAAFTFSGDRFATAAVEAGVGGRWFERDIDGRETSWGEVRAWEPPHRLVLSWRVSPERTQEPPERASEVEVRFHESQGLRTRIEVIHRDFGRHGEGAEAMRAGMASEQGWSGLLERLRDHAS